MLEKLSAKQIAAKCDQIRQDVIKVCIPNGAGHIAPSFSCVEILCALYYSILHISSDPTWEDRDRLVFSKAHGAYALYAILADRGYIPRSDWETFYQGSSLSGCVERKVAYGLEASCGSLGHGLPLAVGIAYGAKLQEKKFQVFCVVGDGELQEGSCWEAIQFAMKYELTNLTIIIDANGLQGMDFLEDVLTPKGRKDDLQLKFSGFGCAVWDVGGQCSAALVEIFERIAGERKSLIVPQVVIAKTTKGFGLNCMENVPKFHFRLPTSDELNQGKRYE